MRQKSLIRPTVAAFIGWAIMAGSTATVNADSVTFSDVTDWSTTPVEVVNINDPFLNYSGGVYAGINTLQITDNGNTTINNGFCIDPFHWSISGPADYSTVPLIDAPKDADQYSVQLNAFTATEIEDLWALYYSPTMSSPNAAGLQIAIWELVSSNAVATGNLPAADAVSITSIYDSVATNDLDSLATFNGSPANLIALTGPGQDYVIAAVPDGGETFIMLALTLGGLVVARPALIKNAAPLRKAKAVAPSRR
ncbi:MAG: hypothetical protein ACLQU4_05145 [Limisphaerales bacterium]